MDNTNTYLIHSYKGTTWSKKTPKYVRKIGNKYYYDTQKKLDEIETDYYESKKEAIAAKTYKTQVKEERKKVRQKRVELADDIVKADWDEFKSDKRVANYHRQEKNRYKQESADAQQRAIDLVEKHKNQTVIYLMGQYFSKDKKKKR